MVQDLSQDMKERWWKAGHHDNQATLVTLVSGWAEKKTRIRLSKKNTDPN